MPEMPHQPLGAAPTGNMAGLAARPLVGAYLDPRDDPRAAPGHVLSVIRYLPSADAPAPPDALDIAAPFEQLGPRPLREVWWTDDRPRLGASGPMRFAATDKMLFGALHADIERSGELERATHEIYLSLLDASAALGFPHLVRLWNAVPRINDVEPDVQAGADLERYQLFCRGRSLAFEHRYGAGFTSRLPSASAVGCDGRRLAIHFIACRAEPRHMENPRQVAAYRYPRRYGPRSPSFARATHAPVALGSTLFVSGTASVVGHESAHPGDPLAQVDEAMRNIRTLLGHAGVERRELRLLKVYVREPGHADAVRARLDALTGGVPAIYLRADICRSELLVEIEAVV